MSSAGKLGELSDARVASLFAKRRLHDRRRHDVIVGAGDDQQWLAYRGERVNSHLRQRVRVRQRRFEQRLSGAGHRLGFVGVRASCSLTEFAIA